MEGFLYAAGVAVAWLVACGAIVGGVRWWVWSVPADHDELMCISIYCEECKEFGA